MKNYIKKVLRYIRNIFWEIFLKKAYTKKLNALIENNQTEKEDKTYYIITCENMPQQGLFGYAGLILAMIWYAINNNMIPIIDMKNYANTYLEDYELRKVNSWELFFKPITSKSVDEVYASCKYIIGNHKEMDWDYLPGINGYHKAKMRCFFSIMYKEYLALSEEAEKYCKEEYSKLLQGKENETLGVLVRGTDLKKCKGHAKQPSLEEVCEKIRELLKSNRGFKYIYLATEEKKSEMFLQKEFPDIIITNKRTYYDSYDPQKSLSYFTTNRERDKYSRGLEYLSSMYILSKCGGLLSGQCGGGFAAYYMNGGKYRYSYFWELGVNE